MQRVSRRLLSSKVDALDQKQALVRQLAAAAKYLTKGQAKKINLIAKTLCDFNQKEGEFLYERMLFYQPDISSKFSEIFADFTPKFQFPEEIAEKAKEHAEALTVIGKRYIEKRALSPYFIIDMVINNDLAQLIPANLTRSAKSESETPVQEAEPEKTAFSVFLRGFSGDGKVKLIKAVKDILKVGLKEAKDMVENSSTSPITLFSSISKEEGEEWVGKIAEMGGEVSLE